MYKFLSNLIFWSFGLLLLLVRGPIILLINLIKAAVFLLILLGAANQLIPQANLFNFVESLSSVFSPILSISMQWMQWALIVIFYRTCMPGPAIRSLLRTSFFTKRYIAGSLNYLNFSIESPDQNEIKKKTLPQILQHRINETLLNIFFRNDPDLNAFYEAYPERNGTRPTLHDDLIQFFIESKKTVS